MRGDSLAALLSLSPAPVFAESYHSKWLPENLDIYFGPPEELFLAAEMQSIYVEDGLIPILDDGNFSLVTFLDPRSQTLVQKYVESPFEIHARFQNWQQYLGALVIRIAESIDDNERVRIMSDLVGYHYLTETLVLLDELYGVDYELYRVAVTAFLSKLGA